MAGSSPTDSSGPEPAAPQSPSYRADVEAKTRSRTSWIVVLLLAVIAVLMWQVHSLKREVQALKEGGGEAAAFSSMGRPYSAFPGGISRGGGAGAVATWDPIEEMRRIHEEMDRLFKDSFGRGLVSRAIPFQKGGFSFDLDTDIKAYKDKYKISMDIPGMDKGDIKVEIKGNTLVVSGERREEKESSLPAKLFRKERSYGYFSRSLTLPPDADTSRIQSKYDRGVLTVELPRKKAGSPKNDKTVRIKVL